MKQKPFALRLIALVLAALMLTGCTEEGLQSVLQEKLEGFGVGAVKNRTISKDSMWVDSSIDGSIDEDSPINVKDDFYTAVNRDFLLEPLPEGTTSLNFVTPITEQFTENLKTLYFISPEDTEGTDPEVLSPEKLRHIQSLVAFLIAQGEDASGRAEAGAQPLEPFLDEIDAISSLEDLTDYFCNTEGQNLFCLQLAPFFVTAPYTARGGSKYIVMVLPNASLSLGLPENYRDAIAGKYQNDLYNQALLASVLGSLGWSAEQVKALLRDCYRFECKLSRCLPDSTMEDYAADHDAVYSREELERFCGSYPLGAILDACSLGASESYAIPCPLQLEELGKLYQEKNLAEIKAYLTVNTVLNALTLLDDDTNALAVEADRQLNGGAKPEAPETEEEAQEAAWQENYARFVQPYLSDAFQQMYVARFCTARQKEDLTDMTLKIQAAFRQTLENAQWLGEETRVEALAKLDHMGLHILYPDELIDYSALSFDGCSNLLDAVARLNRFRMGLQADLVNREVDNSFWDLEQIPTLMVNAVYMVTDNSINILAAFLASDEVYGSDKLIEENLAGIGSVIGHEMTHGFDTSGYQYDLYGHLRKWWTEEDRLSFDTRAADLVRYYSGLTPVSDGSYLDGNNLSGEAIADMGGVKSVLAVAEPMEDFDYDLFFRSYARLWRSHCTFITEAMNASDEHPLAMLRANVTLAQFEKFQETYDLKPGDGMYLAPGNRILVW